MQYKPHTYQTRLKDFIIDNPYAFLTVDMGLGKTVTTLTAIQELKDTYVEISRVLVIAPKSVAENTWTSECAKWDHLAHLRVSVVMGTETQRVKALTTPADIYVINRDNVVWLVNSQIGWPFDTVIIDESSSFKNPQARRFKALRKVRPKIRRLILLTGTPSPNGHMDLWAQMWLIDMGKRLGKNLTTFRTRYFKPGRTNGHVVYDWHLRPGAADEISELMSDVINRDNVAWLVNSQIGWPFDTVIIDESSSFKNPQARRFKALRKVRPRIRRLILLTGTPSPNGHMDLWAQMWLIDMGKRLGKNLTTFRTRYFRPGRSNGHVVYDWHLRPGAADEISELMSDVTVSLKAEDWLEVPDLIETDIRIALSPQEMRTYKQFERDQIMSMDGRDIEALTAAALANKLLQYTGGAMYDTEHGWVPFHDAKMRALEDIIETAGDESILVFYQYKHELERLKERFKPLHPVTFSGEPDILRDWNTGSIRLLLCQPASVQYGLNMQSGGHIIVWYTPTWNLEQYQQANARLHRQGQERPVLCYRLICEGTVDNRVVDAVAGKDSAQESLLRMIREIYADNCNKV